MITYEYPLSERIRTLLRLEDLFDRYTAYVASESAHAHHAALLTLFELSEVGARPELKGDLIQELERQRTTLVALRDNPHVEAARLEDVLARIDGALRGIHAMPGKIGQHLRDNDWFMSLKQRACIPGGMCEFDLPGYHHWLHQAAAARTGALTAWVAPCVPVREAVGIVLGLLRDSGDPEPLHTRTGSYQRMLESRNPQMIRIRLDHAIPCVPEVSANKYLLNVRFVQAGFGQPRTCVDQPIDFELVFCTL